MSVPERIDYDTLVAVYAELGFHPTDERLTFMRDDGLMVFHDATPDGLFPWVHVVQDMGRATAGQRADEDLGNQFAERLFLFYTDS